MTREKKTYLNFLRVFACFTVVMIHIFTTARTDFPNHTMIEEIISVVVINLFHFAVPIFFMITGYLFLSKEDDLSLKKYLKKYVLKYIIAILTFGWGYAIIEQIFNKNHKLTMLFTALIDTIQGKTWAHMWYLYSLIGVMMIIPIVKLLLNKKEEYLKYLLFILIISSFILPLFDSLFQIDIDFDLIIVSPYLTYSIIGYYLGTKNYKIFSTKYILVFLLISSIIIGVTEASNIIWNNFIFDRLAIFGHYNSIFILILSSCIFLLFKNIKSENKIIDFITSQTYGIYLIHMFWINLIYKLFKINLYGNLFFVKIFVLFFIVFVCSYISTKVLKKIPLINKII